MTAILGISAYYHDSAAALVVDGRIVAAAQEERFTRHKHDCNFPKQALDYCLEEAGLRPEDLDFVAFYDKPWTKFERLLETYIAYAPRGLRSFAMAIPLWLKSKLYTHRNIRRGIFLGGRVRAPILFTDHHEAHAASAFFPSPFDEAAILTLDGVGEWSTTTYGSGAGNRIQLLRHLQFPHSLGLLYSAFTYYCGFQVNSGEYKLMGLAPYGQPHYQELIYERLIDMKHDGSFWMNMDYFNYCQGLTMTNGRFHQLFGGPPRPPGSTIERRHMDLAASIQAVTEDLVLRMGREVHRATGMKNLVMAGGVALNCVANGRLLREGPFESIWIQPAAGDAGGALGCALFAWHQLLDRTRNPAGRDSQQGSFLGPRYAPSEVQQFLDEVGAHYETFMSEEELIDNVSRQLASEKVVGWFYGRMEYGPRALGARSILGDPRSATMQATMNLKIKYRESFRPFAPCVLREHVHEWFEMRPGEDSPYMLLVAPVLPERRVPLSQEHSQLLRDEPDLLRRVNLVRSSVPAVTHVDYSARVQTVDSRHGRFYRLMQRFHEMTGCPIVVNTSFNLSWEPIVLNPQHAYRCFMQSEMDVLVLEDCVLHKSQQPLGLTWMSRAMDAAPDPNSPWADPRTGDPLVVTDQGVFKSNPVTKAHYRVENGIPRLWVLPDDGKMRRAAAEVVQPYSEETPFPNYDDVENPRALLEKANAWHVARLLNEQIPYSARVVEVGCRTGQLTNFLSIAHRTVLGIDSCMNSLRLAQKFKFEHGLERAMFAQMHPLRPALKDGFFDIVIANGFPQMKSDCQATFRRVSRLVKPGGYVLVGLNSPHGRTIRNARRVLFRWTSLSSPPTHSARFEDQYGQPCESTHSLDEVLGWMEDSHLEFVNFLPNPVSGRTRSEDEQLFAPRSAGTVLSRFLSQLANKGSSGFFIMIGRCKVNA